jgi:hypothetical protein
MLYLQMCDAAADMVCVTRTRGDSSIQHSGTVACEASVRIMYGCASVMPTCFQPFWG